MPKATTLYTIRKGSKPELFLCIKLTEDLETLDQYILTETSAHGLHCACPAYKPWCKHMDILRAFQAEDRVQSGWLYNHDKKAWIPPIGIEP